MTSRSSLFKPFCLLISVSLISSCDTGSPTVAIKSETTNRPEAGIAAVTPFDMGSPDLVLLLTGGTDGLLEPCDCATAVSGGLARLSGLVRSYRAQYPNTLVVDIGDALKVEQPTSPRNDHVLRGYQQIGYDAMVMADHEWSVPLEKLAKLLTNSPACISSSIRPGRSKRLPYTDAFKYERGELKLAVLSDVTEESFSGMHNMYPDQISFLPPSNLAQRVGELKRDGYVVLIASHADEAGNARIARTCKPDMLLQGHTSLSASVLKNVRGVPVAKVGGTVFVGVVAMKIASGAISDLEYRLDYLDERWPQDPRLLETYRAYSRAAWQAYLKRPRRAGLRYVGASDCGSCHQEQFEAWKGSLHAKAYTALVDAKRANDPDCLKCHTTGFGTDHGFYSFERTPNLVGVGCQICHAIDPVAHQDQPTAPVPTNTQICTSCHTKVTDPQFSLETRLHTARCPLSE